MPIKNAFGLTPSKRLTQSRGGENGKPVEVPLRECSPRDASNGSSGAVQHVHGSSGSK